MIFGSFVDHKSLGLLEIRVIAARKVMSPIFIIIELGNDAEVHRTNRQTMNERNLGKVSEGLGCSEDEIVVIPQKSGALDIVRSTGSKKMNGDLVGFGLLTNQEAIAPDLRQRVYDGKRTGHGVGEYPQLNLDWNMWQRSASLRTRASDAGRLRLWS